MKTLMMSLVLLLSATSHAGGGGGFGTPIDTTVLSCFQLLPVQEGEATAGLHLTEKGLQMGFSNHVNDFNVSFEPVKVITRIKEAAQVTKQEGLLIFASMNGNLRITLDSTEVLASTGVVDGQVEVQGKLMQGRCSVNMNNLKQALK